MFLLHLFPKFVLIFCITNKHFISLSKLTIWSLLKQFHTRFSLSVQLLVLYFHFITFIYMLSFYNKLVIFIIWRICVPSVLVRKHIWSIQNWFFNKMLLKIKGQMKFFPVFKKGINNWQLHNFVLSVMLDNWLSLMKNLLLFFLHFVLNLDDFVITWFQQCLILFMILILSALTKD